MSKSIVKEYLDLLNSIIPSPSQTPSKPDSNENLDPDSDSYLNLGSPSLTQATPESSTSAMSIPESPSASLKNVRENLVETLQNEPETTDAPTVPESDATKVPEVDNAVEPTLPTPGTPDIIVGDKCNVVVYNKTNLFVRKPDMKFLKKMERNISRFNNSFLYQIENKKKDLESISISIKQINEPPKKNKEGVEIEVNFKKVIKSGLNSIKRNVISVKNYVYLNFFEKFRHDLEELFYWQEFIMNYDTNSKKTNDFKTKVDKVLKENSPLVDRFKKLNTYVKSNQRRNAVKITELQSLINREKEDSKLQKVKFDTQLSGLEKELERRNHNSVRLRGGDNTTKTDVYEENDYDDIYEDVTRRIQKLQDLVNDGETNDPNSLFAAKERTDIDKHINDIIVLIKIAEVATQGYEKKVNETLVRFNTEIRKKPDLSDYLEDVEMAEKVCQKRLYNILDYYNNSYSKMDVMFNKHFAFLYIFKILRIGLFFLALFLSSRIFEEMYIKAVFTQNKDPPSLLIFIAIFIAFDFVFCLFIFIVVLLIKYIFHSPNGTFVIDSMFILKMVIDYVFSTILLLIFSFIICSIIQKKKYFRYKLEGPRAIRACQELLFGVASIVFLVPFFLII